MKRRLGIYATYDSDGIIDDYIVYCLEKLCEIAVDVVVVSNHRIPDAEKSKLKMASRIYERDDIGYDAGGFSDTVRRLASEDQLRKYDEVIFLNDSVFGPFYPFQEMFSVMDAKEDLDFWGITKRGKSDFDGGDTVYPEHIQLYFFVVRERMLRDVRFVRYWETILDKVTDFRSAILNYEFMFTEYFAELGYKWDVYCHTEGLVTDNPKWNLSPYHYCSHELIKDMRCPLLKRKLFTGDFVERKYSDRSDLRRAVSYVADHTSYDIDLMWSHVLRVYHLDDVMESMQLVEMVSEEDDNCAKDSCLVRILDNRGNVIPSNAGLCSPDNARYTLFISIEDNGREPEILVRQKIKCVLENMCKNERYVSGVMELFRKKPRLGVLVPPMEMFGDVSLGAETKWGSETMAAEMKNKYCLSVPAKEWAPIHKVGALWFRSHIVDPGLLEDLSKDRTGTVMQMIPLFAQQKGYYTEILINKGYASGIFMNMQRMLHDSRDMLRTMFGKEGSSEEMWDEIYKQRISDFVRDKKRVYVYGAGRLACRVIGIADSIRRPDGVVVSDKNGNSKSVCGYSVLALDEVDLRDSSFIIAVGKKNNDVIEGKLKALGVVHYLLLA